MLLRLGSINMKLNSSLYICFLVYSAIFIETGVESCSVDLEITQGQYCSRYRQPTTMNCSYVAYSCANELLEWCKEAGTQCNTIIQKEGDRVHHFTGYERFTLFDGTTDLHINESMMEDTGLYRCMVDTGQTIFSKDIYLEVVDDGPTDASIDFQQSHLEDATVSMKCLTTYLSCKAYSWFVDDRHLEADDFTFLDENNDTLIISNVHRNQSGFYSCEVRNPVLNVRSEQLYLNVEYPASHTSINGECKNNQWTLNCECDANPEATNFTWSFDDIVHKYGSSVTLKTSDWNGGTVVCEACNVHGCSVKTEIVDICQNGVKGWALLLAITCGCALVCGIILLVLYFKNPEIFKCKKSES